MAFEPNVGQTDAQVQYLARGRGYTAFLTRSGVTLALGAKASGRTAGRDGAQGRAASKAPGAEAEVEARGDVLRLSWDGANGQARVGGS